MLNVLTPAHYTEKANFINPAEKVKAMHLPPLTEIKVLLLLLTEYSQLLYKAECAMQEYFLDYFAMIYQQRQEQVGAIKKRILEIVMKGE